MLSELRNRKVSPPAMIIEARFSLPICFEFDAILAGAREGPASEFTLVTPPDQPPRRSRVRTDQQEVYVAVPPKDLAGLE